MLPDATGKSTDEELAARQAAADPGAPPAAPTARAPRPVRARRDRPIFSRSEAASRSLRAPVARAGPANRRFDRDPYPAVHGAASSEASAGAPPARPHFSASPEEPPCRVDRLRD